MRMTQRRTSDLGQVVMVEEKRESKCHTTSPRRLTFGEKSTSGEASLILPPRHSHEQYSPVVVSFYLRYRSILSLHDFPIHSFLIEITQFCFVHSQIVANDLNRFFNLLFFYHIIDRFTSYNVLLTSSAVSKPW